MRLRVLYGRSTVTLLYCIQQRMHEPAARDIISIPKAGANDNT